MLWNLFPISWAIGLALLGSIFGYFLAPIPLIIVTLLCSVAIIFLVSQNPQAEGGLAILFMVTAIILFAVPMLIIAVIVGTIPGLELIKLLSHNFKWSWIFREH